MLNLIRALVPGGLLRAQVLKWLRWASTAVGAWVLTSTYVRLTTHIHSLSQSDAASISGVVATAAAGLVLTFGHAGREEG
ncbi:MAG TPA: hypothetical protein VHT03_01655 [Rhizomicrobium sp.]|jgi:hypothetical protein|nr:hypothetical protein [Rhizomicrobium sp.]